uniref:Uncharacterized protein LOC113784668 n=1 Tax=Cicer arietinum TaxID=3827 RepID=A0A3Q7XSD2_CICAR|nr:uncharacterized protein LOC113784668 [Cicer arietinum]
MHRAKEEENESWELLPTLVCFSQELVTLCIVISTPVGFTVILIYVGDLLIAGNNLNDIESIKSSLQYVFSIKDLGVLKYFLGFEIARNTNGISLCQRKYSLDLLEETGLLGSKPCSTPMDANLKLSISTSQPLSNATVFRKVIGQC